MTFDDTIPGFPASPRQIHLREARAKRKRKPKREIPRDLRAAEGIVLGVVGGVGLWAWGYVLLRWMIG